MLFTDTCTFLHAGIFAIMWCVIHLASILLYSSCPCCLLLPCFSYRIFPREFHILLWSPTGSPIITPADRPALSVCPSSPVSYPDTKSSSLNLFGIASAECCWYRLQSLNPAPPRVNRNNSDFLYLETVNMKHLISQNTFKSKDIPISFSHLRWHVENVGPGWKFSTRKKLKLYERKPFGGGSHVTVAGQDSLVEAMNSAWNQVS